MTTELNPHGIMLSFGKHSGTLLTRVPVSYLKFMINNRTKQWELAKAEFERRGDTMPTVEISGHALDNASLRVRKIWHETALDASEGLYSWLCRMVNECIDVGEHLGEGRFKYNGMKLVIEVGAEFPVLKTIMK